MTARLRNPDRFGWLAILAASLVAIALTVWLERGLTWGSDEFFWLELSGLGTVESFYHPYGGHLIFIPFLTYRGVLELFGADFFAYSVIQIAGLVSIGLLLYVYAKRRVGPLLALAPALVVLFLGSSWTVTLQPMIGIQFLCALVPALAALVLIEREDLGGDLAACALLCLALAAFTQAAAFLAGAVVAVALAPRPLRRAWVVAVPILAYGAWRMWAAQYGSLPIDHSNLVFLPAAVSDSLAIAGSAVFGLASELGAGQWTHLRIDGYEKTAFWVGVLITIAELVAIGLAFWWMRRRGGIPRTFWSPAAILLVLWVETGLVLEPGRTPGEIRYVYAGVLVLLMVVCEIFRGLRTTRTTLAIAALLTCLAVGGNMFRYREGHSILAEYSRNANAQMTVLRLGGEDVNHAFTPNIDAPDIADGAFTLNQQPWMEVQDRWGTQGDSIAELEAAAPEVRTNADKLAGRALGLELQPAPVGARTLACTRVGTPLKLPTGGATLRSGSAVAVRLGRWSDSYPIDAGKLSPNAPMRLRIPADASSKPWRLALSPRAELELCRPTAR